MNKRYFLLILFVPIFIFLAGIIYFYVFEAYDNWATTKQSVQKKHVSPEKIVSQIEIGKFENEERIGINQKKEDSLNNIRQPTDIDETNTDTPVPSSDYTISEQAWIPNWDMSSGLASYLETPDRFKSISPTWYSLGENSKLIVKSGSRDPSFINTLKQNKTKLIPTVGSGNSDALSKMLNNTNRKSKFINQIVQEVNENNYDGIDIDFEAINKTDKEAFSLFIEDLSVALHKKNKLVTIAVLPKNTNSLEILSKNGVGGLDSKLAQDWEIIGKYVDEFRIMGYDYTRSSDKAGPIAPLPWLDSILKYAIDENVPREKIVLGIPTYAYRWEKDKKGGTALLYSNVEAIKKSNKPVTDKLNSLQYEKQLIYKSNGKTYEIWYQDKDVNDLRLDLAKKYEIKGVIYWRLGGDFL